MDATQLPDILARIRKSDERALEELMRLTSQRLYRIAWAITRAELVSEEILQDVFIAVWDRRENLDPAGNFAGYLYRAVRNQALMALRKENTQERAIRDSTAEFQQSVMDQSHTRRPDTDVGEDTDIDEVRRERIYILLDTLPTQMKEIFMLRWIGGLTAPEIAETLGITVRTVYNQLYRASQRIQEQLSQG